MDPNRGIIKKMIDSPDKAVPLANKGTLRSTDKPAEKAAP